MKGKEETMMNKRESGKEEKRSRLFSAMVVNAERKPGKEESELQIYRVYVFVG